MYLSRHGTRTESFLNLTTTPVITKTMMSQGEKLQFTTVDYTTDYTTVDYATANVSGNKIG